MSGHRGEDQEADLQDIPAESGVLKTHTPAAQDGTTVSAGSWVCRPHCTHSALIGDRHAGRQLWRVISRRVLGCSGVDDLNPEVAMFDDEPVGVET